MIRRRPINTAEGADPNSENDEAWTEKIERLDLLVNQNTKRRLGFEPWILLNEAFWEILN